MLTACGRVHRISLVDLREALLPCLALPDRAKGGAKGDRAKGRNGTAANGEQEEVKRIRKRKERDGSKGGGKSKRKGKNPKSDSVERPTKRKKAEEPTPTPVPDAKSKGKGRKPKSEIPCRFFKRGTCDRENCEFKH